MNQRNICRLLKETGVCRDRTCTSAHPSYLKKRNRPELNSRNNGQYNGNGQQQNGHGNHYCNENNDIHNQRNGNRSRSERNGNRNRSQRNSNGNQQNGNHNQRNGNGHQQNDHGNENNHIHNQCNGNHNHNQHNSNGNQQNGNRNQNRSNGNRGSNRKKFFLPNNKLKREIKREDIVDDFDSFITEFCAIIDDKKDILLLNENILKVDEDIFKDGFNNCQKKNLNLKLILKTILVDRYNSSKERSYIKKIVTQLYQLSWLWDEIKEIINENVLNLNFIIKFIQFYFDFNNKIVLRNQDVREILSLLKSTNQNLNELEFRSLLYRIQEDDSINDKKKEIIQKNKNMKKEENKNNINDIILEKEKYPGGRFENDEISYKDIDIIPNIAEIKYDGRKFLPKANYKNPFLENELDQLLDYHYRLLREDMIDKIHENLQKNKKIIFENVQFLDIEIQKKKRLYINIEFDQLKFKNEKKKIFFWDSSSLQKDSLICIFNKTKNDIYKFGRIYEKKLSDLLAKERCKVGVYFEINDLIDILNEKEENINNEFSMFIAYPSFFAINPILKALKEIEYLPFEDQILKYQVPENNLLDIYSNPIIRLPNHPIFKNENNEIIRYVNLNNLDSLNQSKLDQKQIEALKLLTHSKFPLIQGPPGTGKTFIGLLTAELILRNTNEKILCICYTNHALDQFLEGLIEINPENENLIARVGGNSKSEILESKNLRELSKDRHTKKQKYKLAISYDKMEEIQKRIKELNEKLFDIPKFDIMKKYFIEYEKDIEMEAFNIIEDDYEIKDDNDVEIKDDNDIKKEQKNEWKVVGKDSKQLWKSWVKNSKKFNNKKLKKNELWKLNKKDRMNKIIEWKRELYDYDKDLNELKYLSSNFNIELDSLNEIYDQTRIEVLDQKRIIGITTSGAAKNRNILNKIKPGIIIIEEAAEILESHVLCSLKPNLKQLIQIGDHQQLRPKVENYSLQREAKKGYDLNISLFERLIEKDFPFIQLETQHRMHPDISNILRMKIYPGLKDGTVVQNYPCIPGTQKHILFINHNNFESDDSVTTNIKGTSRKNDFEANMISKILRHLIYQNIDIRNISIITPYLGQLKEINSVLKKDKFTDIILNQKDIEELKQENDTSIYESDDEDLVLETKENDNNINSSNRSTKGVRVSTIDNFQGEEADIILISLVRSNDQKNIGWVKNINRINVLLSRAKHGLIIIGNKNTFINENKSDHAWNDIIEYLYDIDCIKQGFPIKCKIHHDEYILSNPEDFDKISPNGGCDKTCNVMIRCGHVCDSVCHPADPDHLKIKCHKICNEKYENCDHNCEDICHFGKRCSECKINIKNVELPCGHKGNIKCYQKGSLENVKCQKKVKHTMEGCDHEIEIKCWQKNNPSNIKCTHECGHAFPNCSHKCKKKCGNCDKTSNQCIAECDRILICGHRCQEKCHNNNKKCPPCNEEYHHQCSHGNAKGKCKNDEILCREKCNWRCSHDDDLLCELECSYPCMRPPCNKRCPNKLECGHQCPTVCGEDCPVKKYCQICGDKNIKERTIDFILLQEYADIDLDIDPITISDCGCFYPISYLDGLFELNRFYEERELTLNEKRIKALSNNNNNNDDIKKWDNPIPFQMNNENNIFDYTPKECTTCKKILSGIKRYNRPIKFSRLCFNEKKFNRKYNRDLKKGIQVVNTIIKKYEDLDDKTIMDKKIKKLIQKYNNKKSEIINSPMIKTLRQYNHNNFIPPPDYNNLIQVNEILYHCYHTLDHFNKCMELIQDNISLSRENKAWVKFIDWKLMKCKILIKKKMMNECKDEINEIEDNINNIESLNRNRFIDDISKIKNICNGISKEEIEEVLKALRPYTAGGFGNNLFNAGWNSSSHLKTCPNGHPYYIANCGGAMEESECPDCGAKIGGSSHTLRSDNRDITSVDELHNILNNQN